MTTLQIAINAPEDCLVYTLDLPQELAAKFELSELDEIVSKHFRNSFQSQTGSYFLNRSDLNIHQLLGDFRTFDYSILGGKFVIIFIDAAHDYANKKIDS